MRCPLFAGTAGEVLGGPPAPYAHSRRSLEGCSVQFAEHITDNGGGVAEHFLVKL
jgi:hypothetical protein